MTKIICPSVECKHCNDNHICTAKQVNLTYRNMVTVNEGRVDMMICNVRGEMCIIPCVEINYRQTMGMVARILNDQYLAHQATGTFMIEHFSNHQKLVDFVEEKSKEAPLEVEGGRVCKGFMPLVPVTALSQNLAYMEVY